MNFNLKYIHSFVDRLGTRRYYVRINGVRFPMPNPGGDARPSTEFMEKYDQIVANRPRHSPRPREQVRDGLIYFAGYGDYVKIGFTTDLAQRLSELQTGAPEKLKIILAIPGTLRDEAAAHRRFARSRLKGEWFRRSGAIEEWIRAENNRRLLDGKFVEAISQSIG